MPTQHIIRETKSANQALVERKQKEKEEKQQNSLLNKLKRSIKQVLHQEFLLIWISMALAVSAVLLSFLTSVYYNWKP